MRSGSRRFDMLQVRNKRGLNAVHGVYCALLAASIGRREMVKFNRFQKLFTTNGRVFFAGVMLAAAGLLLVLSVVVVDLVGSAHDTDHVSRHFVSIVVRGIAGMVLGTAGFGCMVFSSHILEEPVPDESGEG